MKSLLENDLPAFYGVGRRCICDENTISLSEFDLSYPDTRNERQVYRARIQ